MKAPTSSNIIASRLILGIVSLLAGLQCHNVLEDRKFDQFIEDFLDRYCQFFPVEATLMGNHRYDNLLENYSPASLKEVHTFLNDNLTALEKVDTLTLTTLNRLNYRILTSKIHEKQFELQEMKRWRTDATFYSDVLEDLVRGISLHAKDSTQFHALLLSERIEKIPVLLSQARENLISPDPVTYDLAAQRIERVENSLPSVIDNLPLSSIERDSLASVVARISNALLDFRLHLSSLSAVRGVSAPAYPGQQYENYLHSFLVAPVPLDSVIHSLQREIDRRSDEMVRAAQTFVTDTSEMKPACDEEALLQLLENAVQSDVLQTDVILPFCAFTIDQMKRFIDEIWNLPLPLNYHIDLEWSNDAFAFPLKLAYFEPQGFFDESLHFFCRVNPVKDNQDWIMQLAAQRKYNQSSITAAMLLEANVGHFAYWKENRHQIPILARAFPNPVFLAGWPYYLAFKLLESGFRGYDAKLQYVVLKNYLRVLHLALAETRFYSGAMTHQNVEKYLMSTRLFDAVEVQLAREQMLNHPAQSLFVFWGVRQFQELESQCRNQSGLDFSFNGFISKMIRYGPVSPAYVKRLANEEFQAKKR
ncbi:MAG: DUF885 family protein [Candidatus Zhuqueibacterota bacterium]